MKTTKDIIIIIIVTLILTISILYILDLNRNTYRTELTPPTDFKGPSSPPPIGLTPSAPLHTPENK